MFRSLTAVAAAALLASTAQAAILEIPTVPVRNLENAGEWSGESYGGYGPDRICGAVDYAYNIGKYEVTNAEYTEFFNNVAVSADPHDLYNTSMGSGYGGITRSGSGSYTYSTIAGRGNMPVNYVSFWDACRFGNWLHNGQGTSDTEAGAYTLTSDGITNNTVIRNDGWQWAVASEDEWYKAAYYDGGSDVYYDFPTGSDTAPTAEGPPGSVAYASANYGGAVGNLTDVGAYTARPSESPYGTYDQGGNVWEWNEAIIAGSYRGLRGGSFGVIGGHNLHASYRYDCYSPTNEASHVGFRVASIPEPGSISFLLCGLVGGLIWWRRKR